MSEMTPKEALEHIESRLEMPTYPKFQEALSVLRALVEPAINMDAQAAIAWITAIANRELDMGGGLRHNAEKYADIAIDAITRDSLAEQPTVEEVRKEIQRRLNNLPHIEPHDSAHLLGSCLIDFINRRK